MWESIEPEFNKLSRGDVLLRLRHCSVINLSGKTALEKIPFNVRTFFSWMLPNMNTSGAALTHLILYELFKSLELNRPEKQVTNHRDLHTSHGKISYKNFLVPETSSTLPAKIIESRIDLGCARKSCYKYGQMRIAGGKKQIIKSTCNSKVSYTN